MTIYARISAGIVQELFTPPDDVDIAQCFPADLVATFVAVPTGVSPLYGWSYDGKVFAAPVVVPIDLRAYAAAARFTKETAGITVGNAPIATDRDSQAMITGMWATAQMNPAVTVQFKSAGGGFATINAAQIQSIAAAVSAHVQACFTAEGQVDAAITAGTITTTAQIDQAFAAITV